MAGDPLQQPFLAKGPHGADCQRESSSHGPHYLGLCLEFPQRWDLLHLSVIEQVHIPFKWEKEKPVKESRIGMNLEINKWPIAFLGLMGQLLSYSSLYHFLCHTKLQIVQKPKHKVLS